ncbi:MAG: diguanylate cyclase [Oscillospiraceae bacterium]|nr:diguanylate cyclase [Oscillospiraceae bacterium]
MRGVFSVLFLILILALLACTVLARRSDKRARSAVAFLEAALIPPVLGNLLIVASGSRLPALIGHYFYYLGMDLVMGALVNFTNEYCRHREGHKSDPYIAYLFLVLDAVQMLLNPFFGHAFTVNAVNVEGYDYYKLVPLWGQTVHRITDYGVFFAVILMFILLSVKTTKLARERYTVILATMIGIGLVQTYHIFFQYAIDRSMLGYGVFGVMIYYFAILYRPLRVLDRVLSDIISDLEDAFYIFDPDGNCLWANEQGCRLADIRNERYETATANLRTKFGDPSRSSTETQFKRTVGEGDEACYYVLEEKKVTDARGSLNGSYLRIQDVTAGERRLRDREKQIGQITQEAYRDALTGVGSKAAYAKKVAELNGKLAAGDMNFAVVMVDMNNLKLINDDCGHKAGDQYILGCCRMICDAFKHSPVYRIGGDEFVAILQGQDYKNRAQITAELRAKYAEAFAQTDAEPWCRYSAAVGMAENASDDMTYDLVFKRADNAMYEEKKQFKKTHGSYR